MEESEEKKHGMPTGEERKECRLPASRFKPVVDAGFLGKHPAGRGHKREQQHGRTHGSLACQLFTFFPQPQKKEKEKRDVEKRSETILRRLENV